MSRAILSVRTSKDIVALNKWLSRNQITILSMRRIKTDDGIGVVIVVDDKSMKLDTVEIHCDVQRDPRTVFLIYREMLKKKISEDSMLYSYFKRDNQ